MQVYQNRQSVNLADWARHGAVYLALCTIALAQPLLQMYSSNVVVFAAARFEGNIVLWFALIVLLVPPCILLFIDVTVSLLVPRYRHHVHLALVGIGLWAVISVVLREISFGPWLLDMLCVAVIAAAITMAYHRFPTMRSWLMLLSSLSIVVIITFVTSSRAVIWPPSVGVINLSSTTTIGTQDASRISPSEVSVLWIVLDEAPLFPLLTTEGEINAKRFPGFAALAESSTWYRNVVATSQTTTDAVPAMLTGKWPKSGVGPVLANHPRNLFTLMNGHLAMDAHEIATALCPRKVCSKVSVTGGEHIANPHGAVSSKATVTTVAPQTSGVPRRVSMRTFLSDALVVMGHKVLPKELRNRLPPIDEGWGRFGAVDKSESTVSHNEEPTTQDSEPIMPLTTEKLEKAKSTTVQQWSDGGPMSQVPVVESVITRASQADRPTIHFAHVLLPHRPWMLTPEMRRSRPLPTDKRSNTILDTVRDEYQAHLLQYAATDTIISNLVSTMKKSANWDRTMIIVTADHGITFMPGESKRKTVNPHSPGTLEDLFRVPLFIKYPGQQKAVIDNCTASAIDIFPTIIAATGINAGWKLDGADLLHACPQRASRTVIWPEGTFALASDFSAALERAKYYDSWVDAEGTVDDITRAGVNGDLVGTTVAANGEPEKNLTWSLDWPDDFQNIGTGRFNFVPEQIQGHMTAGRTFGQNEEGLIVVDGIAVGVISELAGLRAGTSTTFRTTLMSRLLLTGKHHVALWVVGETLKGQREIRPVSE